MQQLSLCVSMPGGGTSTLALVAKWPPSDPQSREMAERLGSFDREVGFYRALHTTAPHNNPSGAAAPLPTAAVHFAHAASDGRACLVLEDLSAGGYEAGDQVAGADQHLAASVLRSVAAQHASFWGDPRLEGEGAWVAWLPAVNSPRFHGFDAAQFNASWHIFKQRFPVHVAAMPMALMDALNGGSFPVAARQLLAHLGAAPRTLLHGDLRLDNVMHRKGDAGAPETRYIDLGDCAAGRGAFDVAYFLSMSLSAELRRAHERVLLAEYLAALHDGGVRGYSASQLWEDYRAATAYCLCLAVNLGGSVELQAMAPRKQRLAEAMASRVIDAVVDTGAHALLQT